MKRRDLLKGLGAGVVYGMVSGLDAATSSDDGVNLSPRTAGVPLACDTCRPPCSYSVMVIGDTHYDKAPETLYHAAYPGAGVSERLAEIQRAEFKRNGEMWATRLPLLLNAAKTARKSDTAFAIQVGDLIQGDCNDATVHAKMAEDAFSAIRSYLGNDLPLRIVVGNHDIRNGCVDDMAGAYRSWMNERMTDACAKTITSTNFWYTQGPDLWIHVDFTQPSFDVISSALSAHKGARYKFLVTHGAVIPSDSGSYNWILYGYSNHTMRRKLRALLLANDVIVIAGHSHTTELMECVTNQGRITQIIANSVWKEEALAQLNPKFETPAGYGNLQTSSAAKAYFAEYKPAMVRYIYSLAAGFYRLEVSSKGVVARFFGGDAKVPTCSWRLR